MATEARRILVTAVEGGTKGIRVDRLDDDALAEAIEMRGLEEQVSEDTSREQRAVVVFVHMMDGDREKRWECVKCERCDGAHDEGFPFCPYCGEGLDEHHAKSEEPDDDEPSVAAVEPRAATPSALAGSSSAIVPAGRASSTMAVVKKAPSGALVRYTIKDLDRAVEEAARLKGVIGVGFWDLGAVIAGVYNNAIWRLRTKEDGKTQRYRTWEQACQEEFKMLHQSALNAMDINRRFAREYAEVHGRSKLTILVRAHSDEDLRELQAKMEAGASVAELKEAAKSKTEHRREAGEPIMRRAQTPEGEVVERPMRLPKKRPDGSSTKKPRTPPPGKTTVAVLEGTKGVSKLWARAPGKLAKVLSDTSELARAIKLGDEPIGVIELKNAVSIYVRIVERDDGLALQWEIGRDSEEAGGAA